MQRRRRESLDERPRGAASRALRHAALGALRCSMGRGGLPTPARAPFLCNCSEGTVDTTPGSFCGGGPSMAAQHRLERRAVANWPSARRPTSVTTARSRSTTAFCQTLTIKADMHWTSSGAACCSTNNISDQNSRGNTVFCCAAGAREHRDMSARQPIVGPRPICRRQQVVPKPRARSRRWPEMAKRMAKSCLMRATTSSTAL